MEKLRLGRVAVMTLRLSSVFTGTVQSVVCIPLSDKADTVWNTQKKTEEHSSGSDLHSFNPI